MTRNAGEEVTVMGDNPNQNRRRQTGLEILAPEPELLSETLRGLLEDPDIWILPLQMAIQEIGES